MLQCRVDESGACLLIPSVSPSKVSPPGIGVPIASGSASALSAMGEKPAQNQHV